jgi:hypothetical protein
MVVRFQVDPDFYDHPKSIGMTDAATALWVRAGSYSAAKLLDGFIAEHVLSTLSRSPEDASAELVARGLWRRVKGGFKFHQWDERNLTRARVESDRDNERLRKKRQRDEARKAARKAVENQSQGKNPQASNGNVPPGHPPGHPPESGGTPGHVPPVSVSVSLSESVSGSGRAPDAPNGARPPPQEPPPRTCPEHTNDPAPPPCGRCADTRRAADAWELAEAERQRNAPTCPTHRGQPAHNCARCRSERLGVE